MTGSGLMDFLISLVILAIVVGLIFLALEKIAPDEFFKKIAKYAIGGVALVLALFAIKAVLFGGGGAVVLNPLGVIAFAIGLIVLLVVLYVIYMAIDYFAPEGWAVPIKYIVGAIAIIVILLLAQQVLLGGGSPQSFQRLLR
jgi:hypothetical protein